MEYTLYETLEGFKHLWGADYSEAKQAENDAIDTDIIYNKSDILMAYSIWQETPKERYRFMRAYKRYMERFFSPSVGTTNGIKKDGSGFHHWAAYNNYLYAYKTAISVVNYLEDTRFQVEESNYKFFRDAVLVQLLQANDNGMQALSTSGRKPDARTRSIDASDIKKIAISGGKNFRIGNSRPYFSRFL